MIYLLLAGIFLWIIGIATSEVMRSFRDPDEYYTGRHGMVGGE